ncbi:MAG: LysR family transcriptional regulator, partial [Burkholderiales bacterium]
MERLPLTSVRTFAVVARRLSISRAAEELNLKPSARS